MEGGEPFAGIDRTPRRENDDSNDADAQDQEVSEDQEFYAPQLPRSQNQSRVADQEVPVGQESTPPPADLNNNDQEVPLQPELIHIGLPGMHRRSDSDTSGSQRLIDVHNENGRPREIIIHRLHQAVLTLLNGSKKLRN